MPINTNHNNIYDLFYQTDGTLKEEYKLLGDKNITFKEVIENCKGKMILDIEINKTKMIFTIFIKSDEPKDLSIYKQFSRDDKLYLKLLIHKLLFKGYNTYMIWKSNDSKYFFYLKFFVNHKLSEYINLLNEETFENNLLKPLYTFIMWIIELHQKQLFIEDLNMELLGISNGISEKLTFSETLIILDKDDNLFRVKENTAQCSELNWEQVAKILYDIMLQAKYSKKFLLRIYIFVNEKSNFISDDTLKDSFIDHLQNKIIRKQTCDSCIKDLDLEGEFIVIDINHIYHKECYNEHGMNILYY